MMNSKEIKIKYIRPGKGVTEFVEDLVAEGEQYLKTFKVFSNEIIESLTQSLRNHGLIAEHQITTSVTKIYFLDEYFDLLLFHDARGEILGYYSDIGTPVIRTPDGYQMTDWFLDIWLSPDGTLFELDLDEFEEALSNNLLNAREAEIARSTFARLIDEVKQGIYPHTYMR